MQMTRATSDRQLEQLQRTLEQEKIQAEKVSEERIQQATGTTLARIEEAERVMKKDLEQMHSLVQEEVTCFISNHFAHFL